MCIRDRVFAYDPGSPIAARRGAWALLPRGGARAEGPSSEAEAAAALGLTADDVAADAQAWRQLLA
eukprot:3153875-Alexandrium_andersonii.AAC.1